MMVAPVLAAVLEAQNESRLCKWLGEIAIYRRRKASKKGYLLDGGLYSRRITHIRI